jgi:hypothetical protein
MATEKQMNYLNDLKRGVSNADLKAMGMTMNERSGNFSSTPTWKISKYIESLKKYHNKE